MILSHVFLFISKIIRKQTLSLGLQKRLAVARESCWDRVYLGKSTFIIKRFLGVKQYAVNRQYCVNPAFIPSSPESSSIHRIFPTILVTLSAF